jgi:hypothetical protein
MCGASYDLPQKKNPKTSSINGFHAGTTISSGVLSITTNNNHHPVVWNILYYLIHVERKIS